VAGSVSGHRLPERIPAHTRSSEVNATKYTGVSYFGYRRRKTRKTPCSRPDVGSYVKRCVVAEGGRKDIRRRATNGRVARWVLGMGRGARREEIQPGDPVRVWICAGISICIPQTYCRNWTPVNIAVLGIQARNPRVRNTDIQQRKQVRVFREAQAAARGNLRRDPIPVQGCVSSPK